MIYGFHEDGSACLQLTCVFKHIPPEEVEERLNAKGGEDIETDDQPGNTDLI